MKNLKNLLSVALFFSFATIIGQTKISGKVVDEANEGLPGAGVLIKGTSNGTSTDFDGNFTLESTTNQGILVISFVGYESIEVAFSSSNNNLGTIALKLGNLLDEVVIVGRGVIDLAEGRKTPIAVSTIKASEIQAKAANWDLPEIIKSTPSVHNVKGGGFGDGQVFLRGFDQTNTAFLLNGQPINSPEDGRMFWSNWSGVLDVANAIQVQRGLGSSKLAISSVGGTVNIVTKTIDQKEGGFYQALFANDSYLKQTIYYSTGMNENGFAFSGMFGHWQGDGYVNDTDGQGQTYFLSFGYKPNENNIFNFILTGAPQWHAVAGTSRLEDFLDNGIRYNSWNFENVNSSNTLKSGKYPGGRNIYHKPIANLSWDYTINETSSLSTVLYGSLGRGAFAQARTSNGDVTYARGSNNNHNWYGLVSTYSSDLNENLSLNVGADVRLYNGIHFRDVREFISVNSVSAFSVYNGGAYELTNSYGGINPWNITFNPNKDHNQRFGYDYEEDINYLGVFGQLEYAKDNYSVFFQGSASTQSHVRTEYLNTAVEGVSEESEKVNNPGYNVKMGGSYNLNEQNIIFLNLGYYSRQPYHSDLFVDDRGSNQLNPLNQENQKILGVEAGYKFGGEKLSANFNVYYTNWDNRVQFSSDDVDNDNIPDLFTQTSPLQQIHKGIELEFFSRPFDRVRFNGFVSIGDWNYKGNVTITNSDENGNVISTGDTSYIDGVKIGQAAQFTAGLSADYTVLPGLRVDANWNLYDNLYGNAQFGGSEFSTANNRGAIKLPSYDTADLGVSYRWRVNKNNSLQFRLNVNNVFSERYLESSRDNTHLDAGDTAWRGINVRNRVRFGYGRTWSFSTRWNF